MNASFLIVVFLAGGCGAALRYLITRSLAPLQSSFPWALLLCNVGGCALIGLAAGLFSPLEKPSLLQVALMTGLLGGFTTFSSFSLDSLKLMMAGKVGLACLNVGGSIVLGLFFTWTGYRVGTLLNS